MKDLFSLLKLEFLQATKFQVLKQNKAKFCGFIFLGLLLLLSIFISFYQFYGSLFDALQSKSLFLPLIFLLCSFLIFFLTVYSAKNTLFEPQDKEFLFSLPISSRKIFFSRIGFLFSFSFLLVVFFLLPAFVYYVCHVPVSFLFLLFFGVVTLFIAIIPSILSILFGTVLGLVLNHVRHKVFFENLFYLCFFLLYFLLYFEMNHWVSQLSIFPDTVLVILKYIFYPIYLLYHAFLTFDFSSLLLFILLSLGILLLFVFLFEKKYFQLLQKFDASFVNKKYELKKIKVLSIKKTLIKKEWRRIFTTPIYLFQYGFGLFFLLIFSIASFFVDVSNIFNAIPIVGSSIFSGVFFLYFLVFSFTNFGCVSYSLERNHFWILKVLPIEEKRIFDSKWIAEILIICLVCVISLTLFVISDILTILEASMLFIFSICFAYFNNVLGLLINLLLPKMDALSDVAIIKRSMSSFLGVMIPFVLIAGLCSFGTLKHLSFGIVLIMSIGLIIVGTILRFISISLLKNNKLLSLEG